MRKGKSLEITNTKLVDSHDSRNVNFLLTAAAWKETAPVAVHLFMLILCWLGSAWLAAIDCFVYVGLLLGSGQQQATHQNVYEIFISNIISRPDGG